MYILSSIQLFLTITWTKFYRKWIEDSGPKQTISWCCFHICLLSTKPLDVLSGRRTLGGLYIGLNLLLWWTPSVRSASKPEGYSGNKWNRKMFLSRILEVEGKEEQPGKHSLIWISCKTRLFSPSVFLFSFFKKWRIWLTPVRRSTLLITFFFGDMLV